MAAPGVELLVGVSSDPLFGPEIACAAGGTAVELLADKAVRLGPLTERDVHEMPRSLATFPLLAGQRGAPPADEAALEDVLRTVSASPRTCRRSPTSTATRGRAAEGAAIVDVRVRPRAARPDRLAAGAVGTSLPQPVGAVIAFLLVEEIRALLPVSFAFAAGAMPSLVVVDVAPDEWRPGGRMRAVAGALVGGALMVACALWFDVF